MRTKVLLLTFAFLFQGCTVVGMMIDSKFPPKNDKSEGVANVGLNADIELAKSVIYDEPLPGNEPNQLTGCKKLTGKKQTGCYKVSSQLNKSLKKHDKKQ